MIFIMFLIWALYLILGFLWLCYTIKKNIIKEYNVIGSLILILMWPFHVLHSKFK
jgi:hypothetical protein